MPESKAVQQSTYHCGMDSAVANLGRVIYFQGQWGNIKKNAFVHSLKIHINKS